MRLLESNRYPFASMWIASGLAEIYEESSEKAIKVFASILRGGHKGAINRALREMGKIIDSVGSNGEFGCDSNTRKTIIGAWRPDYDDQDIWGELFFCTGGTR